jgi:kynurenine formamidase
MEKLTNLPSLPPFGYDILCYPVKIRGASAGWIRVVAMFDD